MNKLILSLFMLFTVIAFAQEKKDWEKIKSLKVAFITEKLSLSSKEAQEFWSVYNAYESKRYALRKREHSEIRNKIKDVESLSEKESAQLLKQHLQLEEEEEELDKEFLKEVSSVISSKKTLLLLRSEEDFKRQLIKQYHHNKGGR